MSLKELYPGLGFVIQLISIIYCAVMIYALTYTYQSPFWFYCLLIGGLFIPLYFYYYFTLPIVQLARQKKKKLPLLSKFTFTRLIFLTLIPFQLSSALQLSLNV